MVLGKQEALLPLGLLCLVLSIAVNWYFPDELISDFLEGALLGLSVGFTLASIYNALRKQ